MCVGIIRSKEMKARKVHVCDYCGENIEKGEVYIRDTCTFDADMYYWLSHKKCEAIAKFIWIFVDPDPGMDGESFQDGCAFVCHKFICPNCKDYDEGPDVCEKNQVYCLEKIYEISQTHKLSRIKRSDIEWELKSLERKGGCT